jgi:D-2-hydroxyacid dehydrogenase (NADP+)
LERNAFKLLMSEQARARLQGRIDALVRRTNPSATIRYLDVNASSADIAFVSRDVTGFSTKQVILPATQTFYDALDRSHDLKWVHIHSAGMDRAIYQSLAARGVAVTTSAGNNAKIVAQSALGGLLALARRMHYLGRAQQAREWKPLQGEMTPRDLAKQTVVIVGWGEIAQQLAKYLTMLELNVIIVRKQMGMPAGSLETVTLEQLNGVLPRADWLILACPLTPETHHLIDTDSLRRLPKSAYLINIARGQIVDENALLKVLKEGALAGAFLDVFEHEPLAKTSELWGLPNVIITPHSAGFSDGNESRVDEIFLTKLEHWLQKYRSDKAP